MVSKRYCMQRQRKGCFVKGIISRNHLKRKLNILREQPDHPERIPGIGPDITNRLHGEGFLTADDVIDEFVRRRTKRSRTTFLRRISRGFQDQNRVLSSSCERMKQFLERTEGVEFSDNACRNPTRRSNRRR